jgi:hypothetical protein
MATQALSDALGTTPSLMRGFGQQGGMKQRADFGRQNLPQVFEEGARAEEQAARSQFDIEQGQIGKQAAAERDLAAKSRAAATEMEAGMQGYQTFEAPQISASDYAKNAGMRLLSALVVGGIGGASARAQLVAIREMQDAEDRVQRERFDAAKLKFDQEDKKRQEHNAMLKDRFERMLNLLSKDRNAAMVEAKLIEASTGNGLISAQLRKGNYQKAYELFTKAIEASDKADAELAKQQAMLARQIAVKQTVGGGTVGRGGGGGRILPAKEVNSIEGLNSLSEALKKLERDFKPQFAGLGVFGLGAELELEANRRLGGKDAQEAISWWSRYQRLQAPNRHALYGATLTGNELKNYQSFTAKPSDSPETVRTMLKDQSDYSDATARQKAMQFDSAGYRVPEIRVQNFEQTYGGGTPTSATPAARVATKADVAETAKANRMTEAQAKAELRKRGYTIEGE